MSHRTASWLEALVRPSRGFGAATLVLCRTRAAATAVRRWLAGRGGLAGVDVATPSGLAVQVASSASVGSPLEGGLGAAELGLQEAEAGLEAELPAGSAIAERIRGRPGLTAIARRWVGALRAARLAGLPLEGVPRWLAELESTGWGLTEEHRVRSRFLQQARERGLDLGASWRWERMVLVGFDLPDQAIEPWSLAVARALQGAGSGARPAHSTSLEPSTGLEPSTAPPAGRIPALEVPDVVAEARCAVQLVRSAEDPGGALVLCSEETTARRLGDALHRNGVPCARHEPAPLASHPVAAALERCVRWFEPHAGAGASGPDPLLRVADLAFVLGQSRLGRRLHPRAQDWVDARLAELGVDPSEARIGRRTVAEALGRTRLLDAPLGRWLERLASLRAELARTDGAPARLLGGVVAVEARLLVLRDCLAGRSVGAGFGSSPGEGGQAEGAPPETLGGKDPYLASAAELLDPAALESEAPHTLGAVKSFLLACRVRLLGDPAARAILARLHARRSWPATVAHLREALAGTIDPGVVTEGVQILHYDDYDGRPADPLILLDVHDKGLGRRPSPDPLLTEEEIAALGLLSGHRLVQHRIDQVHRAVAAAGRVVAVVSQRDAGGREVLPPAQLDLVPLEAGPAAGDPGAYGLRAGAYGLRTRVPELEPLAALVVRHEGAPEPPACDDPVLAQLAIGATAEWYREGRGPIAIPSGLAPLRRDASAPRRDASLRQRLEAVRPIAPEWLLPWLGHAEGVPEAALPSQREWSYSGLFRPLSHCLYQAWLGAVLQIREPREVSEELDPREIGNAVHDVLERLGPEGPWRIEPGERLAEVAAEWAEALGRATEEAFDAAVERFGELSPSRRAAVAGQVERWKVHWRAWAADRVRTTQRVVAHSDVDRALEGHPALIGAREALLELTGGEPWVAWWVLDQWLCWAARELGDGNDLARMPDDHLLRLGERVGALPSGWAPHVHRLLEGEEMARLARARKRLARSSEIMLGPLLAVAAEVPFGDGEDGHADLHLRTGPRAELPQGVRVGGIALELGSAPVAVRGRIDRIAAVRTPAGVLLQIVDYKTGRMVPWRSRAARDLWSLKEPQLLLYALVLREAAARGLLPESLAEASVAMVGWDYLRDTSDRADRDARDRGRRHERLDSFLVDETPLDEAEQVLGWLLDEGRAGRWTLHPRPDTCPALTGYAHDHCPYVGACRLRGVPQHGGGG